MKTNLQKQLKALSKEQLEKLALQLGSSVDYLTGHLYYARRVPKAPLMAELQEELDLTNDDMYQHFYKQKSN